MSKKIEWTDAEIEDIFGTNKQKRKSKKSKHSGFVATRELKEIIKNVNEQYKEVKKH